MARAATADKCRRQSVTAGHRHEPGGPDLHHDGGSLPTSSGRGGSRLPMLGAWGATGDRHTGAPRGLRERRDRAPRSGGFDARPPPPVSGAPTPPWPSTTAVQPGAQASRACLFISPGGPNSAVVDTCGGRPATACGRIPRGRPPQGPAPKRPRPDQTHRAMQDPLQGGSIGAPGTVAGHPAGCPQADGRPEGHQNRVTQGENRPAAEADRGAAARPPPS